MLQKQFLQCQHKLNQYVILECIEYVPLGERSKKTVPAMVGNKCLIHGYVK